MCHALFYASLHVFIHLILVTIYEVDINIISLDEITARSSPVICPRSQKTLSGKPSNLVPELF